MGRIRAFFNKIFSKDDVNNSRQIELDIAKAVCLFGMALVHCFETIPLGFDQSNPFVYILIFVLNTCFGASTFIICMGIGLAFTKNNAPIQIIKRGLIMLGLSFVFNFFRFTIIDILLYLVDGSVGIEFIISSVFFVDVLTFAGLALILFGLLKLIKVPYFGILGISLVMAVLGTIFNAIPTSSWITNMLVCPFLPVKEDPTIGYNAYFPLFNWFIFVTLGYGLGLVLKKVKEKGLFYGVFAGFSGLFTVIYLTVCIINKAGLCEPTQSAMMFLEVYDSLAAFLITVAVFGLYYLISHVLPNFLKSYVSFLSKGITKFYVIHWFMYDLVMILALLINPDWTIPNPFIAVLIGLGVYVVSVLILLLITKIKEKKNRHNEKTEQTTVE